jgi:uncharacterized membrane protein
MTDTNEIEAPLFHARLTPYRSLGRQGFKTLMFILLGCWFAVGIVFLSMGAWPIFGFFGLDMLAIWLAFRINYRSARQYEEVLLTRSELVIHKVAASGEAVQLNFNPFWTKFAIKRHPYAGVTSLKLISGGVVHSIGTFLNPEDRESFGKAFQFALARAKS